MIMLNNEYITGLINEEGSFIIYVNNRTKILS